MVKGIIMLLLIMMFLLISIIIYNVCIINNQVPFTSILM